MYWIILVLGVALWGAAHLFKRVAPARRAAMGDPGKGAVAAAIGIGIVLMVIGYRGTDFLPIWNPPGFMVHINNTLMIIASYMLSPAPKRGKLVAGIRHPMLPGFSIWAFVHLLVNGDLASILLFGGLLAWAVITVILINRDEPYWTPPDPAGAKTYVRLGVITVVLVGLVTALHTWLGVWPFPA